MHWFPGSIQEAIAQAKSKKVIFLVYVSGKDERSSKMDETFNSSAVASRLREIGCIAIQLERDSDVCRQFSQIYPVVLVPSTFFIGDNGVPLEIIGGNVTPEEFMAKVEQVLKLQQGEARSLSSSSPTTNEASGLGESSASVSPVNSPVSTKSSGEEQTPSDVATSSSSDVSVDRKVERAKELIMEQKLQKDKLEKEEEKRKERERRKVGQELQKHKVRQQEVEAKQLADDMAKERAEEKAARDKVKEQIAQDRADRAARYQTEQKEAERKQQEVAQAAYQVQQAKSTAEAAARSNVARLQFRFPDGSSVTQQFPADELLSAVREYIQKVAPPSLRAFSLSTTFPRREFSEADYSETLRGLQLAPCSAILVLPLQQAVSSTSGSGALNLIWNIFAPFISVLNYLRSLLFGAPAPSSRTTTSNTPGQGPSPPPREADAGDSPPGQGTGTRPDRPQSAYKRRTPQTSNNSFSRREGNIHRFSNNEDDEDENNTWNGNSTQQM